MATFDVLTEPWLPAASHAGPVREYGLLDLLANAHDLISVVDPAPPIQFGLYRFLVAYVTAALGLDELEAIETMLRAGRFERTALERYAQQVGRERFDLFDPTRPFLQSAPLSDDADREKSIASLFFHLPTGTNVTHFHHRTEDEHAIGPAACARGLVAIAPFMTAGGAGYSPSINGTPPWYVLVLGSNLFETILLNCFPVHDSGVAGTERPAWASETPLAPKQERQCQSLLEGLTWRPRQVRLIPGDGGICTYTGQEAPALVRRMIYGPGFKFAGPDVWFDPGVAYRTTDKGTFPLRPDEGRELWRDTGPLLLLRKHDYQSARGKVAFSRPRIMEQFLREIKPGKWISPGRADIIEAYGMRADKAKVFEWRYERMALPPGVGTNPAAGPQVQRALDLAETVAYLLGRAIKQAYPRDGGGNDKALDRTIGMTESQYWEKLGTYFKDTFLPGIAGQNPTDLAARDALLDGWKAAVKGTGWAAFELAVDPLDAGAEALRRQVAARTGFRRSVNGCLYPRPEGQQAPTRRGTTKT